MEIPCHGYPAYRYLFALSGVFRCFMIAISDGRDCKNGHLWQVAILKILQYIQNDQTDIASSSRVEMESFKGSACNELAIVTQPRSDEPICKLALIIANCLLGSSDERLTVCGPDNISVMIVVSLGE